MVTKKFNNIVVAKGCLDLYFLWVLHDLLGDDSDSWERYTVAWGGGSGRWGSFIRYSLRGQMNTLGEKFSWGIWRLRETMADKPKERGDRRF